MTVYRYRAVDSNERTTTGVLEATTAKDARAQLVADRLFLLDLTPVAAQDRDRGAMLSRRTADELALVTRQFATLAKAGIPIAEALAALVDVIESPKLQIAFRDIRENVVHGMSLGEALRRHPKLFRPFYVNMVEVAEASGNMELVLVRLSEYLHAQSRVRTKVVSALTYPVLMMASR